MEETLGILAPENQTYSFMLSLERGKKLVRTKEQKEVWKRFLNQVRQIPDLNRELLNWIKNLDQKTFPPIKQEIKDHSPVK